MVPLTSELKLLVDAHLGGEQAGRFANRLPSAIFVQTFTAIAALIDCTSQSVELAQRFCLPGKSACRLLHNEHVRPEALGSHRPFTQTSSALHGAILGVPASTPAVPVF